MRLASVFAGQTRTNQPSCAAAPVAGTPTSSAMRDARKNARIRPPALLDSIDYRLWPNNATLLTQNRLALAGEAAVTFKLPPSLVDAVRARAAAEGATISAAA